MCRTCFPVELELMADEPMSLHVEADMGQQVEVGWESTLMVALSDYEDGHTTEWLDIKSDGVMVNDIMLDSEMSPIGSVRGAAEPAFLATKSEVFSPTVLAGGSLLRQPPLAVVETVTARVSDLRLLQANFQPFLTQPWSIRCG